MKKNIIGKILSAAMMAGLTHFFAGSVVAAASATAEHPNIIFILADDAGIGDFSP